MRILQKTFFVIVTAAILTTFALGTSFIYASDLQTIVNQKVKDARASIHEISAKELKTMKDKGEKFGLIDVREQNEFDAGYIEGADLMPRGLLEWMLIGKYKDVSTPIVFYCQLGGRSALTTKLAKDMGYTNVKNLRGGFEEWEKEGFKIQK